MVIAMVATACGGSDDESSDAVDTAATDTTAEENQETADEGDDEPTDEPADEEPTDEPVELTATDTGVTESVIRVGVVFPDTTIIGRDPGDVEAKFQTIAGAINDAGGINGRSVELHVRLVNPLDDNDWETVCVELTEDIEVFAALGLFPRTTADCYAGLNDTIVVSAFAITPDQMDGYTAPGLTTTGHAERLVGDRVAALFDADLLTEGMPVAVVGGQEAANEQYVAALTEAGADVVADTIVLGDGNDLVALTDEMATLTEVWKSSGAEVIVGSSDLTSQALLIGYNNGDIDLPMLLPEGTGVPPSLMRDNQGLTLDPFELATALIDGDNQPTKYEAGADGVRECVDAFQDATGEVIALDESRNNLGPTVVACQVFDIFVPIAEAAGADLTTESFAAAAEAFGRISITDIADASVGPDKFDLSDVVGTLAEFNAEAAKFQPVG
jgi:hypothetical protein